jgi:hypothetical protein
VIEWSLFTDIQDLYADVRITATAANGERIQWYLLRDHKIGPLTIQSELSRLTLAFYYESFPFLNEYFETEMPKYFHDQGSHLVHLKVERTFFQSHVSEQEYRERSKPIIERTLLERSYFP